MTGTRAYGLPALDAEGVEGLEAHDNQSFMPEREQDKQQD